MSKEYKPKDVPIEDILRQLGSEVPQEEWDKLARVSVEQLTHFKCQLKECGKWWSVSDAPKDKEMWACPWCGTWHTYPNKIKDAE